MEMVQAVTLVLGWHLQGTALLIMDSMLEEVRPTFNTNYLPEESEAWEGHASLIWNDKDGAQSVVRIIKFFPSVTVHLQMRKL